MPVYSPVTLRSAGAAIANALSGESSSPEKLEAVLSADFDAREVLLCGSGTQALQLAIESAQRDADPNPIVALPAFSCFDVASAAVGARSRVAFYDLDPESLSPDLESLSRVLDFGARTVVVAPLYGIPVDWDGVEKIVASSGALLIEDAAQGHGASYRDKPLGALGDVSTLSFGRGKGWTGGAGGAVLFRRAANRIDSLTASGRARSFESAIALTGAWGVGRPALYGLPRAMPGLELGETVYHEPRPPERIARSAAAAVLASRHDAAAEARTRRVNAEWLARQLEARASLLPVRSAAAGSVAGYLRFPVLGPSGLRGFGDGANALGIAPSYPHPLPGLSALRRHIVGETEFPGAARLAAQLVTLPVHSLLSSADRDALVERIRSYH